MRRAFVALLTIVLLGYAGAIGYLKLNETSLVYHPADRALIPPPDSLSLPIERLSLTTPDSVELVAWSIPAPAPDSAGMWLLICHGNYGNISFGGRPRFYAYMREIGLNLLAFDYRGYGESGGTPSEQGLYTDAAAAYDYLRTVRGVPAERILIFGHSLGSGVATELATRVKAAGLIVEGAFTSVPDRGSEIYPYLPVRLVASNRFASIDKVKRIAMPKLFLHAPADDIIPIAHGRRLFAEAAPPKRMVETRGGHEDAYTVDRAVYYGAIAEFVKTVRAAGRPVVAATGRSSLTR